MPLRPLLPQIKAFSSPCPTRWGNLMLCARDLQASKQALINACTSDEWAAASQNVKNADSFHQLASGAAVPTSGPGRIPRMSFWEHLQQLQVRAARLLARPRLRPDSAHASLLLPPDLPPLPPPPRNARPPAPRS